MPDPEALTASSGFAEWMPWEQCGGRGKHVTRQLATPSRLRCTATLAKGFQGGGSTRRARLSDCSLDGINLYDSSDHQQRGHCRVRQVPWVPVVSSHSSLGR